MRFEKCVQGLGERCQTCGRRPFVNTIVFRISLESVETPGATITAHEYICRECLEATLKSGSQAINNVREKEQETDAD